MATKFRLVWIQKNYFSFQADLEQGMELQPEEPNEKTDYGKDRQQPKPTFFICENCLNAFPKFGYLFSHRFDCTWSLMHYARWKCIKIIWNSFIHLH